MQLFSNYAQTTLASGITDSATTFTVVSTEGGMFAAPTDGDFQLVTLTDGNNWEVVKVSGRVGDVFTIVREHEGVAQAWSAGVFVKAQITKATLLGMHQDEVYGASLALFNYQNFR